MKYMMGLQIKKFKVKTYNIEMLPAQRTEMKKLHIIMNRR